MVGQVLQQQTRSGPKRMTGVRCWTGEVVVTAKGITKERKAPTRSEVKEDGRARGADEALDVRDRPWRRCDWLASTRRTGQACDREEWASGFVMKRSHSV